MNRKSLEKTLGMDGMSLEQKLANAPRQLFACIDDMEEAGKEAIRAEREYQRASKEETVALYQGRRPATLIRTMVLGDERISSLKEERDLAQLRLDVIKEAINGIKKCMGIWNDMANRDYYTS